MSEDRLAAILIFLSFSPGATPAKAALGDFVFRGGQRQLITPCKQRDAKTGFHAEAQRSQRRKDAKKKRETKRRMLNPRLRAGDPNNSLGCAKQIPGTRNFALFMSF
jgi:hypothetical protein